MALVFGALGLARASMTTVVAAATPGSGAARGIQMSMMDQFGGAAASGGTLANALSSFCKSGGSGLLMRSHSAAAAAGEGMAKQREMIKGRNRTRRIMKRLEFQQVRVRIDAHRHTHTYSPKYLYVYRPYHGYNMIAC